jgi:hypothetical protein
MTGRELWKQYQEYTRDITEHGRKLGFAGAAVCWIFKRDDFTFPSKIYTALFFFVAYFIADILHSLSAALTLKFFIRHHEIKLHHDTGSIEGDIPKPAWVDWPAFTFFILKCILLITGFVFIGLYLVEMWELKHTPLPK